MRRWILFVAVAMFAASSLSGCYGNFALTKKVYQINGEVKDKYLRSAVTWAFVLFPVYGAAALVDFVALNTIEFWSGNNPMAAGEKDFQYAEGDHRYDIHAVKSGDKISYDIRRHENGRYVDNLKIQWDLRTGTSTATHAGGSGVTEYVATLQNQSVLVQTAGSLTGHPERVALYVPGR